MRLYHILWVIIFLAVNNAYSQDSTMREAVIKENISPVTALQDGFYSSPALMQYQRSQPYSMLSVGYFSSDNDLYLLQEGSGKNGFAVNAGSYVKPAPTTTIWGSAYYINQKTKNVKYNESIDYNLVYPYVMADTVGGNLNAETYFFSGGLVKQLKYFNYAFTGGFRGSQAYRDRDPRPKDVSSTVDATLSVSKNITSHYVLSADLNGTKYGQSNNLKFENRLGAPLVFHDAGLGIYNGLLAGSRTSATYTGNAWGTQLNISPSHKKGFVAQLGYKVFNLKKLLVSIPYPVGEVEDKEYRLLTGYMAGGERQNFTTKAEVKWGKREGTEAKFNNRDSESAIQKISEDIRFVNNRLQLNLQMVYGKKSNFMDWYVGARGSFNDNEFQYVSPSRNLSYTNLLTEIQLTGLKTIRKTLVTASINFQYLDNLSSSYNWSDANPLTGIYSMLAANYNYLSSNQVTLQGTLRTDYPVSPKANLFIKAAAGRTNYNADFRGNTFTFTTGIIF